MANKKEKMIASWQPSKEQRKWIDKNAKRLGGGTAMVMRELVNRAMEAK